MSPAGTISFLLFGMSAALVGAAWVMTLRLVPEQARAERVRWLLLWSVKGLLVPLIIWAVMNVGISWNLQPFMPQVQAAQNSGKGWAGAFFRVLLAGLLIISSFWTAATLGWALVQAVAGIEGEVRANFRALCWTCFVGMGLPALGSVVFRRLADARPGRYRRCSPRSRATRRLSFATKKRPPVYARAIARMKMGKYTEAEWEIIQELERLRR